MRRRYQGGAEAQAYAQAYAQAKKSQLFSCFQHHLNVEIARLELAEVKGRDNEETSAHFAA